MRVCEMLLIRLFRLCNEGVYSIAPCGILKFMVKRKGVRILCVL